MGKSSKGSVWERKLAVDFSLWWSKNDPEGPRDDLCWRTSGSGARATVRGKKGKKTSNHYGDLMWTDQCIKPFFDYFLVECKRGYSSQTIQDLLDCPSAAKVQIMEGWINKAKLCCAESGAVTWMIVFKRNHREPIIMMKDSEFLRIYPYPLQSAYLVFYREGRCDRTVRLMHLSEWLEKVKPEMIKKRLEER